jgi:gamma-glutamylcyclotransferase (GGCT)/AIG2-like uncharacterized protein YtfP
MGAGSRDEGLHLVCYGSLQPGQKHFSELGPAGVKGQWQPCRLRARLGQIGPWKVIELDEQADWLEAQLLTSPLLEQQWPSLDEFEGQAYQRVCCTVYTANGPLKAYVYIASGLPLEGCELP